MEVIQAKTLLIGFLLFPFCKLACLFGSGKRSATGERIRLQPALRTSTGGNRCAPCEISPPRSACYKYANIHRDRWFAHQMWSTLPGTFLPVLNIRGKCSCLRSKAPHISVLTHSSGKDKLSLKKKI